MPLYSQPFNQYDYGTLVNGIFQSQGAATRQYAPAFNSYQSGNPYFTPGDEIVAEPGYEPLLAYFIGSVFVGGIQYPLIQLYGYTDYLLFGASDLNSYAIDTTDTYTPCFMRGTHLATSGGERPVEALVVGDMMVTASGKRRPIKWIGRRSYDKRFLAAHPHTQPIRFRAGSLGKGLPRRDLLVSPEHAMFIDGLLIPARCLVNGKSIVPERGLERVDYFHVELDTHDVLLAEGAPSESFYDDNGSRGVFHNVAEFHALYPAKGDAGGYCAPRHEGGLAVETIRRRLIAIADPLDAVAPAARRSKRLSAAPAKNKIRVVASARGENGG